MDEKKTEDMIEEKTPETIEEPEAVEEIEDDDVPMAEDFETEDEDDDVPMAEDFGDEDESEPEAEAELEAEPVAPRPRPYEFYAPAARGLEEMLAAEVRSLGITDIRPLKTGVSFFGTLADAYRVLLWSRLASRVQLILGYVDAGDSDELYHSIRNIHWEEHFDLSTTFAVEARGMSPSLRNTQYTALRVKDAICDRFRDVYDERPNVSPKHPDIRIDVSIHGSRASVALDLAGDALNHRTQGGTAMRYGSSARESLAAGALVAAGWADIAARGGILVDPMCGSGALVLEAAMIACDMAPGILRSKWGFDKWKKHDFEAWDALLADADDRVEAGRAKAPAIIAIDPNVDSLQLTRRAARAVGLEGVIDFRAGALPDLATIELPEAPVDPETGKPIGLVATIPPTGANAISAAQRPALWAVLGERVRARFEGFEFALVTGDETVDAPLGMRAKRVQPLPDGRDDSAVRLYDVADDPSMRLTLSNGITVFASEPNTGQFADRLAKMRDHRSKWARRTGVYAYRLYDADLPDYNIAIDVYNGAGPDAGRTWVCVSEYAAPREVDPARAAARLADALAVIPPVLGVEPGDVFLKVRRRSKGGSQYSNEDRPGIVGITQENEHLFEVNLSDYLDTGLFLDHRETRKMVGEMAEGKRFLNLFAYTGTATVYAAAGGALDTTTVDLSGPYLSWARRNLELNGFETDEESVHQFVKGDVMDWVHSQRHMRNRWDLIFVDPPTFSNSTDAADWDLDKDHAKLLVACARLLTRNGTIVFSCNKRGFKPDVEALRRGGVEIKEITARTIPDDFERNPKIHSCYLVTRTISDGERAHLFGDEDARERQERRRDERAVRFGAAPMSRREHRDDRRDSGRRWGDDRRYEAEQGSDDAFEGRNPDVIEPSPEERVRSERARRWGGRHEAAPTPQEPVGDGKYRGRLEPTDDAPQGKRGPGRGRGGDGEQFESRGYDDRRDYDEFHERRPRPQRDDRGPRDDRGGRDGERRGGYQGGRGGDHRGGRDGERRGGQGGGYRGDRRDGGYRGERGGRDGERRGGGQGGYRGDRNDRGGFRGDRDGNRGGYRGPRDGERRDNRGGRDGERRGGYQGGRGGQGGYRGDRDGNRGGYRGDRNGQGGGGYRGSRDGERRGGGQGGGYRGGQGGSRGGSYHGDERRSFRGSDDRGRAQRPGSGRSGRPGANRPSGRNDGRRDQGPRE